MQTDFDPKIPRENFSLLKVYIMIFEELSKKAIELVPKGILNPTLWIEQYNKIYGELIVRECMSACVNEGKTFEVKSAGEFSGNLYSDAIKKHFKLGD